MRELRVTIRVVCPLPGLLVGLQAVSQPFQQAQDCAVAHPIATLSERPGELHSALGRPPQRRAGITSSLGGHQPLELLFDPGMRLLDRLITRPPTTHATLIEHLTGLQLTNTPTNRLLVKTSRPRDCRDAPIPMRTSLCGRPQPPPALIQHALLPQQPKTLPNRPLINHTNRFYTTPANPPLIEMRALTWSRGQGPRGALSTNSSVLYTCEKRNGTLRVTTRSARCKKGEKKLSFNEVGPRGPAGAAGPSGATGPAGKEGPTGPAGKRGESYRLYQAKLNKEKDAAEVKADETKVSQDQASEKTAKEATEAQEKKVTEERGKEAAAKSNAEAAESEVTKDKATEKTDEEATEKEEEKVTEDKTKESTDKTEADTAHTKAAEDRTKEQAAKKAAEEEETKAASEKTTEETTS